MKRLKVAIVGASGYSGEELIRLLIRHPDVEITCITSRQHSARPVGETFPRFAELDLAFSEPHPEVVAKQADVAFLALPHGVAAEYAVPLLNLGMRVIDISADFRLKDSAVYEIAYGKPHPAPDLLGSAVYGLPERRRDALRQASLVACPGCYPTSVILPCAPVLAAGLVRTERVLAASISGVTGAGRKVDLPYIFPECNESLRPYAVTGHRHIPEMEQELRDAAGTPGLAVTFVPHLAPVNRGIHSTLILDAVGTVGADRVREALLGAYDSEPFVRVLPHNALADTKHVTWSNMAEIGCACDADAGTVILSCAIDNLTKGASGQAVQCMNIMFGFDEACGLR